MRLTRTVERAYPTFTHVPPRRAFSTAMTFFPYCPLALLAAARPPLPIPRTRKSHSIGVGAMTDGVEEKWREKVATLCEAAVLATGATKSKRDAAVGDSLSAGVWYSRWRSGTGECVLEGLLGRGQAVLTLLIGDIEDRVHWLESEACGSETCIRDKCAKETFVGTPSISIMAKERALYQS